MRDGEELDRLDHFLSERGEAENTRERGQSRQSRRRIMSGLYSMLLTPKFLFSCEKKIEQEWQSAPRGFSYGSRCNEIIPVELMAES